MMEVFKIMILDYYEYIYQYFKRLDFNIEINCNNFCLDIVKSFFICFKLCYLVGGRGQGSSC